MINKENPFAPLIESAQQFFALLLGRKDREGLLARDLNSIRQTGEAKIKLENDHNQLAEQIGKSSILQNEQMIEKLQTLNEEINEFIKATKPK